MAKPTENALVKSPHRTALYDVAQINEFMKCADPVTGPAYFMANYFYIQHPTKGRFQYVPFPYQVELADCYHNYRFSINLLGRQLGKCVWKWTKINVRHANGDIYYIPIGKLYEYESAKKNGNDLPDISSYKRKDL